jgi:hypothetical protein
MALVTASAVIEAVGTPVVVAVRSTEKLVSNGGPVLPRPAVL